MPLKYGLTLSDLETINMETAFKVCFQKLMQAATVPWVFAAGVSSVLLMTSQPLAVISGFSTVSLHWSDRGLVCKFNGYAIFLLVAL